MRGFSKAGEKLEKILPPSPVDVSTSDTDLVDAAPYGRVNV